MQTAAKALVIDGAPARPVTVSLAVLCLTSVVISVDRAAFPVLIEPMRRELGLTDTHIGLLTGIAYTAMYALASIPIARWADRGDRRLIISLCMAMWSVMTAVCGMAQSMAQLFVARFGVGIGEAGSAAPAQSLIADYYTPERRALPLSLFILGMSVGTLLGSVLVGFVAGPLGWRTTLVVVGLPGVLVALLIHLLVDEPRSAELRARQVQAAGPTFLEVGAALLRKRSCVHIAIGFAVWGFAAYGVYPWLPPFFMRTHAISLTQVGLLLGGFAAAAGVGLLFGGFLANRLMPRDLRWGLWLPTLGVTAYTALLLGMLLVPSLQLASASLFLAAGVAGVVSVPVLTTITGLVGSNGRAVSLAILGLLAALIGGGLGPLSVGALSDQLQATLGDQSLRYAIALVSMLMFWGAFHLYLASRHVLVEFEDRGSSQSAVSH